MKIDFGMRWVGFLGIIAITVLVVAPRAWALDPAPPNPDVKAVEVEEEGAKPKEKIEQHAPTIEVGDTRKFMKAGPLSTAPEDEWGGEYSEEESQ